MDLLTLGDKRSQHQDIENCKHFIAQIQEWAAEEKGDIHGQGQANEQGQEDEVRERPADGV